jgi:uncharacterized phiE125 gp8 family phage protein
MPIAVTTAPAIEPITRAEAKANAAIAHDADDALLDRRITAAREAVEEHCGRRLITQTLLQAEERFPARCEPAVLRLQPVVQSVTSVTYLDPDGDRQTWDSAEYLVDAGLPVGNYSGRLMPAHGFSWPIIREQHGSIEITYVSGCGDDASDVPATIRAAIEFLVAHWLITDREGAMQIPAAFFDLLGNYRVW